MRIYVAGPLFTLAERRFNAALSTAILEISRDIEVVLPQYETAKMAGTPDFAAEAFRFCLQAITECDAIAGLLDGSDVDSGTCVELGYAYANKKPILGIRTDFRPSEDRGLNLMVANICTRLIAKSSLTTSVEEVARAIVDFLHEVV